MASRTKARVILAGVISLSLLPSIFPPSLNRAVVFAADASPGLATAVEASQHGEAEFSALVDKYFDSAFKHDPNWGTKLGLHQYDNMSPDMSASAIAQETNELKDFQKQFAEFQPDSLGRQSKIDLALINSHIQARLLSLDEIKDWQRDPDRYSSMANAMIFELMKRNFAPLSDRLKSVIAREKRIKDLLQAGKDNVKNPPQIYTKIAMEQMTGIINFFQKDVPDCFSSVKDAQLQKEFQTTNQQVLDALKQYQKYLSDQLLPNSNGRFQLGSKSFQKKLLYEQMITLSIDQLLNSGYAELKRLQKDFEETARAIDPSKTPAEVMTAVSLDHPAPNKLLSSTAAVLQQLKDFCIKNNIVTIPPHTNLQVAEMPPFKRALSFASTNSPGPFETKATEAYYNITVPGPDWSPQRTEEYMRVFTKYDLLNTSVHEAYPGNYLQELLDHNAPSKTTKIISCDSNIEGWAHYCEQMMVEQGLENYDKKLKLIMLHDALLRCCRYIVGICMHTKGMTIDEGIAFFMKEGYQERANAERETKRGAVNPMYLVYTLGKMQIMALRDDYKIARGSDFSLKDFHDRFLAAGCPPVKIIREILLEGSDQLSGR